MEVFGEVRIVIIPGKEKMLIPKSFESSCEELVYTTTNTK